MDDATKVIGVKWDGDVYMPSFPRHYNERCAPVSYIALDEDNKFMIDGATPKPVNLTPGALGVRCEE